MSLINPSFIKHCEFFPTKILANHALSLKVFNFDFNVKKIGCGEELGKKWSMKHQAFKSFNEVNNIIFYCKTMVLYSIMINIKFIVL
jgi:hypothetical protein